MNEINLVYRVRKERVPGHKERKAEKIWDEVVKEDMKKRGMCINDAKDRQVEMMLQKSVRPRLNRKNTLPSRQNGEEVLFIKEPVWAH